MKWQIINLFKVWSSVSKNVAWGKYLLITVYLSTNDSVKKTGIILCQWKLNTFFLLNFKTDLLECICDSEKKIFRDIFLWWSVIFVFNLSAYVNQNWWTLWTMKMSINIFFPRYIMIYWIMVTNQEIR